MVIEPDFKGYREFPVVMLIVLFSPNTNTDTDLTITADVITSIH